MIKINVSPIPHKCFLLAAINILARCRKVLAYIGLDVIQ